MSNFHFGGTESRFVKKGPGDPDDGRETEGDGPDGETMPPPKSPLTGQNKNALGRATLLNRERRLE